MGQQQLLLLVLGIVIVGLAVVVGIQAFSENQKKANADALVNDAIRIASDAQAWMLKPTAFGGGGNSCATTCDWTGADFAQLGYATGSAGNILEPQWRVHDHPFGRYANGRRRQHGQRQPGDGHRSGHHAGTHFDRGRHECLLRLCA